jgi:hypothetical protein
MHAVRGAHTYIDSSASIHQPSAAMVIPSAAVDPRRRVKKAVADIEAKAEAEEKSRSNRANNAPYGTPYNKRKRSGDDTRGQSTKRQVPPNNKRLSSNEWMKAQGPRLQIRMPPKPPPRRLKTNPSVQPVPRPQRKGEKAFLRLAGYIPPQEDSSNKVIVISDDEEEDARLVWARYKEVPPSGILPTDSHQDDIVVNSIEVKQYGDSAGAAHYVECLSRQENYDRISTTFDEYRTNGRDIESLPDFDRYRNECPAIKREATLDYSKPPTGHISEDLTHPIYKGQTKNPLVCLAIIRIAQTNLPSINFNSALDHIHNIRPTDPFPQLPKNGLFADGVKYIPRADDSSIKTIFIPEYYQDGRHALGFYVRILPGVTSVLFTPCTDEDLNRHGLFKLAVDDDHGLWEETVVAVNDGKWFSKAEIAYWRPAFNWVSEYWASRLKLIMGGEEDP